MRGYLRTKSIYNCSCGSSHSDDKKCNYSRQEAQCGSSSPPSLSLISWQTWAIFIKSAAAL